MKSYLWRYYSRKIKLIGKSTLEDWQCEDIRKHYVEVMSIDLIRHKISEPEFNKLNSDLRLALFQAMSRHKRRMRETSFWSKIKINLEFVLNKLSG